MSGIGSDRAFCSKNMLNALVIDQVAHLVFGPNPTDADYNSVAVAICDSSIHDDIAKLAVDIIDEAEKLTAHRAF